MRRRRRRAQTTMGDVRMSGRSKVKLELVLAVAQQIQLSLGKEAAAKE